MKKLKSFDSIIPFLTNKDIDTTDILALKKFISDQIIKISKFNKSNHNLINQETQTDDKLYSFEKFKVIAREYGLAILKENKTEIDNDHLEAFFNKNGFNFEEIDYETQKILKSYIDTIQKQNIFEVVLQIIEKEDINIEEIIQNAFTNTITKISEEQSMSQSDIKLDFNKNKAISLNSSKICSIGRDKTFNINLKQIKNDNDPEDTPKGFHQEIDDLVNEFSESWRNQWNKEKLRGKKVNK